MKRRENSVSEGGNEEIQAPLVLRTRTSDLLAGISVATLLSCAGFLYSLFRNVGQDLETRLRESESRITKRLERIEDRVNQIAERRK